LLHRTSLSALCFRNSDGGCFKAATDPGWEHISFNGDYVWPTEPLIGHFRPLRNPRSPFLEAA
jgi:hypothetical protein